MGEGSNHRIQYSPGVATAIAVNGDPLLSIGGGSPHGVITSLPDTRGSEIYGDTEWVNTLTNPYAGRLQAAFTGSLIFAEAGDWLVCVSQNKGDEPSYSAADDCRGSFAKIVTLVGDLSETSNETAEVNITLDRPLTGLAVAGDNCRVIKAGNVFSNITAAQSLTGRVDHSGLWYWQNEANSEDTQWVIEPIQANGCKIELMRPSSMMGFRTIPNVLSSATDSPFTAHDRAIVFPSVYNASGPPDEITNQVLARQNGALGTRATTSLFRSPMWLRRTVPPDVNPGQAVFALRILSEQLTDGTALNDFDSLNGGSLIVFDVAPPASRTMVSVPDRLLYAGRGARLVTTLGDGLGNPLKDRSLVITAAEGTIAQDDSILTDTSGEISTLYTVPIGAAGLTETFTATLSTDPAE